jgi:hypothetical protein
VFQAFSAFLTFSRAVASVKGGRGAFCSATAVAPLYRRDHLAPLYGWQS